MRRYVFTEITELPRHIGRQAIIDCLHDHSTMIGAHPLATNFERCDPLRTAPADEYHSTWYQITDEIRYLPGISRRVTYKACFYDLPTGLQTHVYTPRNVDIQEKWSVGGNMLGERRQTAELGVPAPREGLYLRADVNLDCRSFLVSFVVKRLKDAHQSLVERLIMCAGIRQKLSETSTGRAPNVYELAVPEQHFYVPIPELP